MERRRPCGLGLKASWDIQTGKRAEPESGQGAAVGWDTDAGEIREDGRRLGKLVDDQTYDIVVLGRFGGH